MPKKVAGTLSIFVEQIFGEERRSDTNERRKSSLALYGVNMVSNTMYKTPNKVCMYVCISTPLDPVPRECFHRLRFQLLNCLKYHA